MRLAGANPVNLLKKSAGILKRTWGEALIGYVGLAFANTMVALGSLGPDSSPIELTNV